MPPIATNELDAMTKEAALACTAPELFLLSKELGEDGWTEALASPWSRTSLYLDQTPRQWHNMAQNVLTRNEGSFVPGRTAVQCKEKQARKGSEQAVGSFLYGL